MKDMPITMEPDGWMGQTGGYAKDMTLRQHIAIEAMKGLLASAMGTQEWYREFLAESAYNIADLMLKHPKA